jgi:hypothetical protein
MEQTDAAGDFQCLMTERWEMNIFLSSIERR